MAIRIYPLARDLHLYTGLFISPFVTVFALSVFWLVHPPSLKSASTGTAPARTVHNLEIPVGIENLSGRDRVDAVRTLLGQAHVQGEVGFIQYSPKKRTLSIPVTVPGRSTTLDVDLNARTATIEERDTGFVDSLILLHKSPGPHLADIRMNWLPIWIWRLLADSTCYLLLFISASGIYLWAVLKAERRAGLVLLTAGTISFFGMVYALAG